MRFEPLTACEVCPLYVEPRPGKKGKCVHGFGPEQSDILIIGEAPGDTETTLGRPFVGQSGEVLNRALKMAGIARSDVYCTNAAMCQPPKKGGANTKPDAKALKACRLRLFEDIRIHQPRIVVCLGGPAWQTMGGEENITAARGRERWLTHEELEARLLKGLKKAERVELEAKLAEMGFAEWRDGGVYIIGTFHPAFAARNPDVMPDIVKDLGQALLVSRGEAAVKRTIPEPVLHVPTRVMEAAEWVDTLAGKPVLACDIESRNKDVIKSSLLTLAYAWRDAEEIHALVLPAHLAAAPAVRARLRVLHRSRTTRFIWWNGKFDRKWYKHHLGITVRIDGDGMLAHYTLDPRPRIHGLKMRASDDLGAADYEKEISQYTGKGENYDMGKVPFDKLVKYTSYDVGLTLMLTEMYEEQIRADEQASFVYSEILLRASRVLSEIELTGIPVNVRGLRSLDSVFKRKLEQYTTAMREAAGVGTEFNPASTPQVVQILYGDKVRTEYGVSAKTAEGLPTFGLRLYLNDKKTPGTGADVCDKILHENPDLPAHVQTFISNLRAFRLDAQLHRTYVRKLPRIVDRDGRARTTFNLHTVRSGRLSSSDPFNLQNIPTRRKEGKQIKEQFMASLGYTLVELDLSQAELRIAAFISGDPVMQQIYVEKRDFHNEVGILILGSEDAAKTYREFVKTFNFARLYGAEDRKLTMLVNDAALERENRGEGPQKRWTIDEVSEVSSRFAAMFPTFNEWAAGIRRDAKRGRPIVSHFGRKRQWQIISGVNLGDVEKEAVNHPIQGPAADCLTLSLVEIYQWLRIKRYLQTGVARIVATVHDSLLLEVKLGYEQEIARKCKSIMEELPRAHGITVPMVADAKMGPNWGALEKVPLAA